MDNRNIEEAWEYHNSTKHPGMPPHYLDWENQPVPFKIYSNLDPISLPEDLPPANVPALKAVSETVTRTKECVPDLKTLGSLLFLSAGITRKKDIPGGGEIYFRAAACTGALYHIDLYVVTGDIDGLEAGVYHFSPHDFSLRRLRSGDFRHVLANATSGEEAVSEAPLTVVCTSTFWRNSWKYQSRAYRHSFWDTGTILANLLAASSGHDVPAKVVMGFVDSEVNRLLGLDTEREVAVSLVPLGRTKDTVESTVQVVERIDYETEPLSEKEVDYPLIRRMHDASSLTGIEEVQKWRQNYLEPDIRDLGGGKFPLEFDDEKSASEISRTLEETILKRGSTRKFDRGPITLRELSNMVYRATREIPADFLDPRGSALNDVYLIANDVEELPSGSYFYLRDENALFQLDKGDFRDEAGHLGLGQRIPADASADVFFLSDLSRVLEKFGNRGYRAAQLEAAIMGGRLYLSAYAQKLGASGLTFYDDDVIRFFSPHARGKSVMFMTALGKSVKRGQSD